MRVRTRQGKGAALKEIPVGSRFGELVILSRAPSDYKKPGDSGGVYVFAKCDCGVEMRTRLSAIVNRGVRSCNRASHWDRGILATGESMLGKRFGALVVVAATIERHVSPSGSRAAQVLTRCDCGQERYARINDLNRGLKSCGGPGHKPIEVPKQWTVHGKRGAYAVEGVGTGLVKIGAARDIKKRMWKLQPSSPVELRLIASSADDIEGRLHALLDAHRRHGEWFEMNEDVMSVIFANMKPDYMSVMLEFSTARAGTNRGSKHRCKRCGDLGHHAKTCAVPLGSRHVRATSGQVASAITDVDTSTITDDD